jgi:hypothetical protein
MEILMVLKFNTISDGIEHVDNDFDFFTHSQFLEVWLDKLLNIK